MRKLLAKLQYWLAPCKWTCSVCKFNVHSNNENMVELVKNNHKCKAKLKGHRAA